jgi:hypothetical protein
MLLLLGFGEMALNNRISSQDNELPVTTSLDD